MLTDAELEALFRNMESDRVERKATFSSPEKVSQAICAFANDLPNHGKPGVIFIGVNDDGSSAGIDIDDDLLLRLAGLKKEGHILPVPTIVVQKRVLGGHDVAVIIVPPSYNPPVRYKGTVWIRVGPSRNLATAEEEKRLSEKRRAGDLPFDHHPVVGATLDDLDLDRFEREYLPNAVAADVLEANHRPLQQKLKSLRLLTRDDSPTVASILTLGKDPLQWIPGSYVQFLRFDGENLTDPIRHQREISGTIGDIARQVEEVLTANISVATDITSDAMEARQPDYPLPALQQIFRNAIMHRTYETSNAPIRAYWFSDRIEIHSPGGLYGHVTPENFSTGVTDYRNPLVAEGMKVLGYVQRFGVGIPIARQFLERNGNPPPVFTFQPNTVLVTIYRRKA